MGRYVVREELGAGGMATVYQAFDLRLRIDVALKVLPQRHLADPSYLKRFREEAHTLAELRHENILRLFDFGEDPEVNLYILVLEYLPGGDLKKYLQRPGNRPLTSAEVVRLLRPVASALDYAHGRRYPVVHRDLKPANLMFGAEGQVIVSDFGLAKMLAPLEGDSGQSSRTMGWVGTPQYMAPEQAQQREVSPATDVYALGVIAYEMLVGSVPFSADTPVATLIQIATRPLPLPRVRNPKLNRSVEDVLIKALAKEPPLRYPTAGALVSALESASGETHQSVRRRISGAPTVVAPAAPPPRTLGPPTARNSKSWVGALAAASAAVLLLVVALFVTRAPSTPTGEFAARPIATLDAVQPASVGVTVAPTPGPTPSAAAAPVLPTAAPTAVPTLTNEERRDRAWAATLAGLDATWGNDWPAALADLDAFGAEFGGFPPATDKMYSALVVWGQALRDAGAREDAAARWERAEGLGTSRHEAAVLLAALTPTATATPTSTPVPTRTPTPVPAPAPPAPVIVRTATPAPRVVQPPTQTPTPAPARPAPPPPPPTPTPTKAPFRP
jgi:hypothetical protein